MSRNVKCFSGRLCSLRAVGKRELLSIVCMADTHSDTCDEGGSRRKDFKFLRQREVFFFSSWLKVQKDATFLRWCKSVCVAARGLHCSSCFYSQRLSFSLFLSRLLSCKCADSITCCILWLVSFPFVEMIKKNVLPDVCAPPVVSTFS